MDINNEGLVNPLDIFEKEPKDVVHMRTDPLERVRHAIIFNLTTQYTKALLEAISGTREEDQEVAAGYYYRLEKEEGKKVDHITLTAEFTLEALDKMIEIAKKYVRYAARTAHKEEEDEI